MPFFDFIVRSQPVDGNLRQIDEGRIETDLTNLDLVHVLFEQDRCFQSDAVVASQNHIL
ncbi:MAG: hypothetical protein AAF939_05875 [Planctomycetota bacterium]